jgi:hypothetical protein
MWRGIFWYKITDITKEYLMTWVPGCKSSNKHYGNTRFLHVGETQLI